MRVIITKYALTSGILVEEARKTHSPTMIKGNLECFHAPDWHTDRASAAFQVGRMVAARRRSLTKALNLLDDKIAVALASVRDAAV